jgi:capsular exopolysaccharide synthesis family protein
LRENDESAPESLESVQLREYVRVLRSRKWSVIGTLLTVLLITAIFTFAQTPTYRSTCLLLIEPHDVNVANVHNVYDAVSAGIQAGNSLQDYYKTQFEILKSEAIIRPVFETLHVGERPEFRNKQNPYDAFLDTVWIDPIRDSRLVKVHVDSHDAAFATAAANSIVTQFIEASSHRQLGVSDSGLKKLMEKELELRPRAEQARHALQEFKENNNILLLDESQSIAAQALKQLSEERIKVRADHARVLAENKMIQATVASGGSLGSLPEMADSHVIEGLTLELAKVEQERDDLLKRFKPSHPLVHEIDARVALVKTRLTETQEAILKSVSNKLAAVAAQEQELDEAVGKAEAMLLDLGRKAVRLQSLKDEADAVEGSYKNVAQRVEEVEIAMATGTKENNLFVIDSATPPPDPVKPKKALYLAIGGLLGLMAGIGLCFLLEYLDNTLKGKEDCERLLAYPILGFVPRVHSPNATVRTGQEPLTVELTAFREPRAAVAESFRSIRTGLGFTLPTSGPTAIVVTSAGSGDGKTFVSVNLAYALAQTGKRVLLVDADLRRPRIVRLFGFEELGGLSTTIAQSSEDLLKDVRKTTVPTLDVLPSGPTPPNPAELLGTRAMGVLLERALAAYDWVVIDAPPVTAVADAAILLTHAPHAIFVVRPFTTPKEGARTAKEILDQSPGRVAGVVLNTVDVPVGYRDSYYHYAYYYYKSNRNDVLSAEPARSNGAGASS